MLFDIVREFNDKIALMMNGGMPGKYVPKVFGVTDGTHTQITFMDNVVWDSSEWKYLSDNEDYETGLIREHIKVQIGKVLTDIFKIQF